MKQTAKQTAKQSGFTMLELMIAIAMIGILAALSVPGFQRMRSNGLTKASARSVADMLDFARSKAMQTGNPHLIFFGVDTAGNPYLTQGGTPSPMFVVEDSVTEDCLVTNGELIYAINTTIPGIGYFRALGNPPLIPGVPATAGDVGDPAAVLVNGMSFTLPGGAPAQWILFGGDGIPRRFDAGALCDGDSESEIGRGGGTVYVNGTVVGANDWDGRQYAIEVSPLGGVKIQRYDWSANAWRIR